MKELEDDLGVGLRDRAIRLTRLRPNSKTVHICPPSDEQAGA
ncbi:hypothetical protein [Variovorax sp. LT1R16]